MTQQIDHAKLKVAAEHLEWVLGQHGESDVPQALLRALSPLLDAAKRGQIEEPMDEQEVPGSYDFVDGLYRPFRNPSLELAYTNFRIELRGGLTDEENEILAEISRYQSSLPESKA